MDGGDSTPEGEVSFDDDPIGPFGNAILYSVSLSMLHFTLDVIVYSQYREEIVMEPKYSRGREPHLPIFLFLVYMLHTKTATRFFLS